MKEQLKDWERRFKIKYGRAPTKQDVIKNPVVFKLYQQYKRAKDEIIEPSPSKGGTTSSIFMSDMRPFIKRLDFESPRRSILNQIPEFFKPKKLPFGLDLNKSNSSTSNPTKGVSIEEDNVSELPVNLIVGQMVKDPIRTRPNPTPKKHGSTPLRNSLTPIKRNIQKTPVKSTVQTPIKLNFQTTPIKRNIQTTPIKRTVQTTPVKITVRTTPANLYSHTTPVKSNAQTTPVKKLLTTTPIKNAAKTPLETSPFTTIQEEEISTSFNSPQVIKPSSFIKSRVHRRGLCNLNLVPDKSYTEFLTPEEVQKFAKVIQTLGEEDLSQNNQSHDSISIDSEAQQENIDKEIKIAPQNVKKRSAKQSTDNEKEPAQKKPRITRTRANSKTSKNDNFRALKMKKTSSTKVGSGFRKIKQLEKYNDRPAYLELGAGYDDEFHALNTNADEFMNENEPETVKADFVRYKSSNEEDLVQISSLYIQGDLNISVDIEQALFHIHGIRSFRLGQRETIARILQGESSLLILPTGGGKSLCYQMPTFILRNVNETRHLITLVISPTISLIIDQIRCLPKCIKGAMLASGDDNSKSNKLVLEQLSQNKIDILFISPERLQSEVFLGLLKDGKIPPISFVCLDEVHCMSEWSHNFRTSYLSLPKVISFKLNPKCVLGLTSTLTGEAKKKVCERLHIADSGVVSIGFLRENLKTKIAFLDEPTMKDTKLVELLHSKEYNNLDSIIIYVMFQAQAENLAQTLRIRGFDADSYHAGRPNQDRENVQTKFLRGKLRLIVATVAFGLGINKSNVDSVIHYCLPKSVESYVQEIGRAGRDGRVAQCHLFLTEKDYLEHRSFCFSDYPENESVSAIIKLIYKTKTELIGIDVEKTEKELNIKCNVLGTVLGYLEQEFSDLLKVLPVIDGKIIIYPGKGLASYYERYSCIEVALQNSRKVRGGFECDTIKVAQLTRQDPRSFISALWELQTLGLLRFKSSEKTLVLKVMIGNDTELQRFMKEAGDFINHKMQNQEDIMVDKIDSIYEVLKRAAVAENSLDLFGDISDYFSKETVEINTSGSYRDIQLRERQRQFKAKLELTIKEFIRDHHDKYHITGRVIAKILHGLSSAKFPAYEWSRSIYWNTFKFYNYKAIARMATKACSDHADKIKSRRKTS